MTGSARKFWLAIPLLVLLAVAVGVLIGRFQPRSESPSESDRRAYATDSGDISLAEGLRRGEIALPDCMADDLRYALLDNGFGYYYDIYLAATTDDACVNAFLEGNRMVARVTQATRLGGPEEEGPLEFDQQWSEDVVAELGWAVGPDERFQEFLVTTSSRYRMTALIRHPPDSPGVRVYLHASRAG